MKQSKVDSIMEVVTSTALGFVLSMITWHFVSMGYGIPMPIGENLQITGIFTIVSLARGFGVRRFFNGRTIWQAIKDRFSREPDVTWPAPKEGVFNPGAFSQALLARQRVEHLINREAN